MSASVALAPAWAARKLDARHAQLSVEIRNLCSIAETVLDAGDVAAARDLLADVHARQEEQRRIESAWVPRA